MSINNDLEKALYDKKLVEIRHSRGFIVLNRVLATTALFERQLNNSNLGLNRQGMPKMRAAIINTFDSYISDDEKPKNIFKLLDNTNNIFEVKIIEPRPGVRVFGAFLNHDIFICINLRMRDQLDNKWKLIIKETIETWDKIFPNSQRIFPNGAEKWNR